MYQTKLNHLARPLRWLAAALVLVSTSAYLVLSGSGSQTSVGAAARLAGLESATGLIVYTRGNGGNWDMYGSDASGDNESQLTDTSEIEFDPRWSHDASEIAFHTRDDYVTVWRVSAAGGTPTPVAERIIADYWAGFPAWHPANGCISFAGAHSSYDGRTDLLVSCTDEAAETLVASDNRNESGSDWAHDGGSVAYEVEPVSGQGGSYYWGIRAIDSDGTNDRVVVDWEHTSERHPRWSPTGQQLAFISYPNAFGLGAGSLYLMDTATGLVTEVLRQSIAGQAAWSPDGTLLLATAIKDSGPQPVGDFQLVGSLPPGERKGLYLVDLTARTVERLNGAAGGSGARPGLFEWGYGPDWTGGTPTSVPTATATFTATATASPTATATRTTVPVNYLPLVQRLHVLVTGTPEPQPSATPEPEASDTPEPEASATP